jgi:hypothetical protein
MNRFGVLLLLCSFGCGQNRPVERASRELTTAPKARPDLTRLTSGQEAIAYGKARVPVRDEKGEWLRGSMLVALDAGDRVMILDDDGPEGESERLVRVRILKHMPEYDGVGVGLCWMERKDLRPVSR